MGTSHVLRHRGGGQGGSFQTPGIKQGMFVFGFFLMDLMNKFLSSWECLGNNAKTIIKGIGSKEGDLQMNYLLPRSGYNDDGTPKSDDQLMNYRTKIIITYIESTDANNKNNAADKNQKDKEKKRPIECPKHGNTLTSMAYSYE